jgi:hypothetical protein
MLLFKILGVNANVLSVSFNNKIRGGGGEFVKEVVNMNW